MSDEHALAAALARIAPTDAAAGAAARAELDAKTKPRGSLGKLEELACRIASVRGFPVEPLTVIAVLAAADHGVTAAGVSAYPSEVTSQMLLNLAGGGAAASVLARTLGVELVLVDAGVAGRVDVPGVRRLGIALGTADMTIGPALSRVQAHAVCGRGTGLDDAGLARKIAAVERALAVNGPDPDDAIGVLAAVGGLE